jgi:hypothetical protein
MDADDEGRRALSLPHLKRAMAAWTEAQEGGATGDAADDAERVFPNE